MHMLPRLIFHKLAARNRPDPLPYDAVFTSRFRVWPTDLDIFRHVNNGKYLSIMDVARFDLIEHIGLTGVFTKLGWYPVVVGQTISYRKSLELGMAFGIESRILGFDDQAVYIEQRFVRPDTSGEPEIYAVGVVRGRILRRSGGVVPITEVISQTGAETYGFEVPEEILQWGKQTRLPSTKAPAPSVWPYPFSEPVSVTRLG